MTGDPAESLSGTPAHANHGGPALPVTDGQGGVTAGKDTPADAPDPSSDGPDDTIAIGRIGPARGVRGDVFVEPWTDAPEQRFTVGVRLITDPVDVGPLEVETSSFNGGKLVVHFVGYDGRVEVETLRGVRLFIPLADRPELEDPDEFYDTDLVGLAARHVDGSQIGPVLDVVHAGPATYLLLDVAGQERLVPFVSVIVPEVDVAGGTVTVDPPDGLFDL